MADQYTRCVAPADFVPRSFTRMTTQAAALAFSLGVPPVVTGDPGCLLIAAEIGGLAFLVIYLRHFLYERLICLPEGDLPGGDRDAIGAVIRVSEPQDRPIWDPDDDYNITLLLPCTPFGATKEDSEQSPDPHGELVRANDVITNPPVSLKPRGYFQTDEYGTKLETWGLHAEFEGAGVYARLQAYEALLGLAALAYFACLLGFPGWILAAFFLLVGLAVWVVSRWAGPGQPSDVNPDLPTIHVNNEDNGRKGRGADLLYVQGTWVFDPIHEGWNEIHPVKVCEKYGTGTWTGEWPAELCPPDVILMRLRDHFEVAQAPETQANQSLPEHQWQLHPDIDGCATVVIT